jgi:hypothetical protein
MWFFYKIGNLQGAFSISHQSCKFSPVTGNLFYADLKVMGVKPPIIKREGKRREKEEVIARYNS